MKEVTETKSEGSIWARLLYMVLFVLIFGVAEFVLYLTAAIGFLFRLFDKPINSQVRSVGHSIGLYLKEIADFLSFNTETAPFPFAKWPTESATSVTPVDENPE